MYVNVPPPQFNFPWKRPRLLPDSSTKLKPVIAHSPADITMPARQDGIEGSLLAKLNKVEFLLAEKNRAIDRLGKELEAERSHRLEFDKVKNIMDTEITRLKEQIKNLKQGEIHA